MCVMYLTYVYMCAYICIHMHQAYNKCLINISYYPSCEGVKESGASKQTNIAWSLTLSNQGIQIVICINHRFPVT